MSFQGGLTAANLWSALRLGTRQAIQAFAGDANQRRMLVAIGAGIGIAGFAGFQGGFFSGKTKRKIKRKLSRSTSLKVLAKRKPRGRVDGEFFRRLLKLLRIAVPSWYCREAWLLAVLALFLVIRTYLSIRIAEVNGSIVREIVARRFWPFCSRLFTLASVSIPASLTNATLKLLGAKLAMAFRERLAKHYHSRYLQPMMYYKVTNLDSRISNPDQALTETLDLWGKSLSELYSNLTKPMLDIVLFSLKLSEVVGPQGPAAVLGYYAFSGVLMRLLSPAMGKLHADAQRLEGEFRFCHNRLITHSEEIAFYGGHAREKDIISGRFDSIMDHQHRMQLSNFIVAFEESMLVRYFALIVAYSTLSLPVFGPGSEEYLKRVSTDTSQITRDYISNSSLLINLSKAVGKIIVSLTRDMQKLAGYTLLVTELDDVLNDLEQGRYSREMVEDDKIPAGAAPNTGEIIDGSEEVWFRDVPIVTPNGDLLVEKINFSIKPGMNLMITGPNGSGKSSLFRVLGELWPLWGGALHKPARGDLFYVPQRPYLAVGTLRDQVIYPHSEEEMHEKGYTDEELLDLLDKVKLTYIVDREGGWDALRDWQDVLSGGEKQRIAMARLIYHRPRYAILDECTSAVSVDVEQYMYEYCKEIGISLITISHRPSLWRFHDWRLHLDGRGAYTFDRMVLPDDFNDTP